MPEIVQMYAIQRDRDGKYWRGGAGYRNTAEYNWADDLRSAHLYRAMAPVTTVLNQLRTQFADFRSPDINVRLIEIRDTEINVPH